MSGKPGRAAILIPGLLFGSAIWAALSGGDDYLISTGQVGFRSTLFFYMFVIVSPALLVTGGVVSETLSIREGRTGWTPRIPYLSGLLAVLVAGFLFIAESSAAQYSPAIAPGLVPRLGFMTGMLVISMPFVLAIGAVFALFSLAGGCAVYRTRNKRQNY